MKNALNTKNQMNGAYIQSMVSVKGVKMKIKLLLLSVFIFLSSCRAEVTACMTTEEGNYREGYIVDSYDGIGGKVTIYCTPCKYAKTHKEREVCRGYIDEK